MYDAQKQNLVSVLADNLTKEELYNVWQALNYGKPVMLQRSMATDGVSDMIEAIEVAAGGAGTLLGLEAETFRRDIEAEVTGHVSDQEFVSELDDDPEFLAALHHEEEVD